MNGSYNDLVVVYAGQSVQINLTSASVTQGLYLPFRTQNVVNVQVVPGYPSYASFVAPTSPGIYPMPESEYDGPWFGLDMADLLVLPAGGTWTPSAVNDYAVNAADWDLYASPVWLLSSPSVSLTADAAGLWAGSIPGPTIVAPSGAFDLQVLHPALDHRAAQLSGQHDERERDPRAAVGDLARGPPSGHDGHLERHLDGLGPAGHGPAHGREHPDPLDDPGAGDVLLRHGPAPFVCL